MFRVLSGLLGRKEQRAGVFVCGGLALNSVTHQPLSV